MQKYGFLVNFFNCGQSFSYFWMNSQRSYDEYLAKKKHNQVLEDVIEWTEE